MECSVCSGEIDLHRLPDGTVYWDQGHNAQPLKDGQCCDACNVLVVARRIKDSKAYHFAMAEKERAMQHLGLTGGEE